MSRMSDKDITLISGIFAALGYFYGINVSAAYGIMTGGIIFLVSALFLATLRKILDLYTES